MGVCVCGSIIVLQIYILFMDSTKILRLLSITLIAYAFPNYKLASFSLLPPPISIYY